MDNLLYNYTNVNQSKRLMELGLDPKTADMYWELEKSSRTDSSYWNAKLGYSPAIEQNLFSFREGYVLPCWSFAALFKLMPELKTEYGFMQPYITSGCGRRFRFMCFYKITYNTQNCETPIDAAFEMMCWLLENGHIKKEETAVDSSIITEEQSESTSNDELSEIELRKLKHALGFDNKDAVDGVFESYRRCSSYDKADDIWEKLVKKGYARRSSRDEFLYVVTESGMQAVSDATGLIIRFELEFEPNKK